MQSTSQQAEISRDQRDPDTNTPVRPEPMISDRLSMFHPVAYVKTADQGRAGYDFRSGLAAAFRKLGRGMRADAAYERAKDFYKSSGHKWTHSLD